VGRSCLETNMPRVKPEPRVSTRLKLTHCIFCGEPGTAENPITDEHVWSDWLKKIIPRNSTREESRTRKSTEPARNISEPPKALMGDVHTKKAKVVCKNCNSGWMNDIVQAAIPVATATILKRSINLNASDQKRLATWAALQAMMADLLAKDPIKLTRGDLDYLYAHRQPPPELFIGFGTYFGPKSVGFNRNYAPFWSVDSDGNRVIVRNLHTISSIMGALYVVTCRPDPYMGSPADVFKPCILQIWPNLLPMIPWPAPFERQITGRFGEVGTMADHLATVAGTGLAAELRARGLISD
jgi:hypothetical protein